ncbi:hypothetical protein FGADI_3532 [Fusarium gaditjirri]|uniref:Uncharacterized protein n=1 Tax=Fusarium gaditjirri TaxID=282569 RepID=A0A8H4TFD1_9HYPO|nr:hypothetical protein FGADI_3532 [Fusarium gaditjirri]
MGSSKKKKCPSREDCGAYKVQRSREEREESSCSWINDCVTTATSPAGLGSHNSSNTHTKASHRLPEETRSVIRDPSIDIKDAGTGHHDNRMTKLPQGQFREPSLRRGYGMPYQTPKAFNSMPAKETSKAGCRNTHVMDSLPETQTQPPISAPQQSLAISKRPLPNLNKDETNYDLSRPQARRGDLQPDGYRPVATRHPAASGQMATDGKQGKSSDKKKTSKIVIDPGHYKKPEHQALLRETVGSNFKFSPKLKGKEPRRDKWKIIKGCVEKWCESRRFQLAEDEPETSGSELDGLLDQWKNLYATKFCSANRRLLEAAGWREAAEESPAGIPHSSRANHESAPLKEPVKGLDFEVSIWPSVKDELMEFAESRILRWATEKLQDRLQALESLTRPPLLKANSSPESYQLYLRYLIKRTEAAGKNSKVIRNTEAVMSMALDLLPGLEERLRDQLEHVVDKQEDRPENDAEDDQANASDEEVGNGDSGSTYENLEADHDIDHKDQEAQEESNSEDEVKARLVDDSEEDEDDSGDGSVFEEVYAEDSDDDTYQDPDEPDRKYRGSVLETIEPRTPIVTPRSMAQLRRYEQRYWDMLRAAKVEEEAAAAIIRSMDEEERKPMARKRKASGSAESALAIRSKLMEQRLAVIGTPTPIGRKKPRFIESQCSPASTTCSSEFPSLEDIFSPSIGRASSAATQPLAPSSSPVIRASKKKKKSERKERSRSKSKVSPELGDNPTDAATAPKPEGTIGASPGLFVTPDPGTRQANSPFVFKKSVARHPVSEERFREETAEFQALTPGARESMLYTALREMRRLHG